MKFSRLSLYLNWTAGVLCLRIYFNNLFQKKVIISLTEHIGDIVACEPIIRQVRKDNPRKKIYWIINHKYADLLKYNIDLDGFYIVHSLSQWILTRRYLRFPKYITILDLHLNNRSCSKFNLILNNPNQQGITLQNYFDYGSILYVFSKCVNLKIEDEQPRFHIEDSEKLPIVIPNKYIVVHVRSNEETRNWELDKWYKLLSLIITIYPNLAIVSIGKECDIVKNHSNFYDCTGILNFNQIANVIKNATLFIGVESAFGHFANALNTRSVILSGVYRTFVKYFPYSGWFSQSINFQVIQHNDIVKNIQVETVLEKVKYLLNEKEN